MKPSVFVSSTYIDLKYVREKVAQFIEEIGYEPRLFEKGGVGFDFQKPIDESCYEAVNECDMFVLIIGGRYGAPASAESRRRIKQYNSITRKEYLEARNKQIPIYIFVEKDVLAEFRTWSKNKKSVGTQYVYVDNTLIFDLIESIYSEKVNNYIQQFSSMEDITESLKSQWASMLKSHIKSRLKVKARNTTRINSLKLFYYRTTRPVSLTAMAKETGIHRKRLSYYEYLQNSNRREFDGYHVKYFPELEFSELSRIERFLDCRGKLVAGQSDDFLAMYAEYYAQNHSLGNKRRTVQHPMLKFETRIVVLDFDGTMTLATGGSTTWELIWEHLGYSVNECAMYHSQFRNNLITHEEWCEITLEKFRSKGFNLAMIQDIAKKIAPILGLNELVANLRSRGIRLYILSGSVRQIIDASIDPVTAMEFEAIKANEFRFDADGTLSKIIGTRFDFAGKADFLRQIVHEHRCSPMDVLFVGNAGNDSWASKSGARTLCVNPTSTDPDNPKQWTYNIRQMSDMREILQFV